MKKCLLFASIFAACIPLAIGSETPTVIDRPGAAAGPIEVSAGIWIVDISKIDSAEQSFTAEIAVVLKWKDPRLAHTGSGLVRYPLEQVWHPRVGIANVTLQSLTEPASSASFTEEPGVFHLLR